MTEIVRRLKGTSLPTRIFVSSTSRVSRNPRNRTCLLINKLLLVRAALPSPWMRGPEAIELLPARDSRAGS